MIGSLRRGEASSAIDERRFLSGRASIGRGATEAEEEWRENANLSPPSRSRWVSFAECRGVRKFPSLSLSLFGGERDAFVHIFKLISHEIIEEAGSNWEIIIRGIYI